MKKQRYSVDFTTHQRKYKYTYNDKSYQLNIKPQIDRSIGATRMPQSTMFSNQKIQKYRPSAHFVTFDSKGKRQPFSLDKKSQGFGNKFNSQVHLPTIKKSTTKYLLNPEENNSSYFKKISPQKILNKKVYYQSLIHKTQYLKDTNYLVTLANNHFVQTVQALKAGKFIKIPSPRLQIKLHKKSPKLKTVFLDLDQTLIHCDQNSLNYTVKLDFPVQGGYKISAGIRVRPYCKQFLQQLSNMAQIIIFTASSSSYADVVLKYLDPYNKIFAHKLYRQHCTQQKGYYIKDLRTVNRRLQDSVLVDNSAHCFMLQPYNGIPIVPYYHYKKDMQLMSLLGFLKQVLKADDVRVPIKNTFFWHKYFQNESDPKKIFDSHFSQNFYN